MSILGLRDPWSLILFVLLTMATRKFKAQNVTEVTNKRNCSTRTSVLPAYKGWPFRLSCETSTDFAYDLNYGVNFGSPDYVSPEDIYVECTISILQTGKILLHQNGTFSDTYRWFTDLPDVINSSLQYKVELTLPHHNICESNHLSLNLSSLRPQTCQEAVESSRQLNIRQGYGRTFTIGCTVPSNVHPKLKLSSLKKNYSVSWQRNCSNLPNNVEEQVTARGAKIFLPMISYSNAGIYTCKVTYNGMTRYVTSYNLCVRPPHATSIPVIVCSKSKVVVELGEDVTLKCTVSFGHGRVNPLTFAVKWNKTNDQNFECYNGLLGGDRTALGMTNHSCNFTLENPQNDACISDYSTSKPKLRPALMTMRLKLKNIQPSDLGTYRVILKYTIMVSATVEVVQESHTLSDQSILTIALSTGLGGFFLIALLIVSFICCWKAKQQRRQRQKEKEFAEASRVSTISSHA